jgi:hypothetical protein
MFMRAGIPNNAVNQHNKTQACTRISQNRLAISSLNCLSLGHSPLRFLLTSFTQRTMMYNRLLVPVLLWKRIQLKHEGMCTR